MTEAYDYDLIVVGGGSGGIRAARTAAELGARVALCEARDLGGTCVNLGCVPKKFFVYSARYADELEDARAYGWDVPSPRYDWGRLIRNKDAQIGRLRELYERRLREAGVTLLRGRATLADPHTVTLGGAHQRARFILIATGGWPLLPELPGRELCVSSNEIFGLPTLPERVAIVGGGYVAAEFAGIFHGLGSKTTLIHRGGLFLKGFDEEIRAFLAEEMRKKGIDLRFDTRVSRIERGESGLRVIPDPGAPLGCDLVLCATGRAPQTRGLGLEAAGAALDARGAIVVDGDYRSSVSSIYAIGDVTDRVRLTPVAIAEGMAVAHRLFGAGGHAVDYALVPSAVFSQPELASVGLTEVRARSRYPGVAVYASRFTPLKNTLTGRNQRALVKLIVDRRSDRVLGAHMVGPEAAEVIQGIAIALASGATKATFDATLGIHPTLAEEFVTLRRPRPEP